MNLFKKTSLCFSWLFILFVLPSLVYGQKDNNVAKAHKGNNEIEFSFTPQYYFNKLNVHNDGVLPGLISAKNTAGFNLSIDYHRITPYGLVYGAGASFGQIGHDVTVNYKDFSFFYPKKDNPVVTDSLKSWHADEHVVERLNYLSLHPSVGYRFKLPGSFMNGWDVQADLSCDFVFYLNGLHGGDDIDAVYTRNGTTIITPLMGYGYEFGTPHNTIFNHFYSQYFIAYGLNLSLHKEINRGILSDISAGIKVTYSGNGNFHDKTRGAGFVGADAYDINSFSPNISHGSISHNEYRARDFSVGLKLGVGLWPVKKKQENN